MLYDRVTCVIVIVIVDVDMFNVWIIVVVIVCLVTALSACMLKSLLMMIRLLYRPLDRLIG